MDKNIINDLLDALELYFESIVDHAYYAMNLNTWAKLEPNHKSRLINTPLRLETNQ